MEHLLLKAATTVATDQGEFEAVISTATIDRERDIVDPAGFVRALQKWVPLGKKVPLAWNHSSKAEDQIGYIDPASVRVDGDEVIARGWIDRSMPVGRDAWKQVKRGTLGFSFGYLVPTGGSTPRKGGGRHIRELDVFEVTATPAPMNGDTRVLGWKALKQAMAMPDGSTMDMPEDDANECLGMMISMAQAFINDEDDPEDVAAMQAIMTSLLRLQGVEAAEEPDDGKSLRDQATELSRQHKDGPDKTQVELETLRAERDEQAERLKSLETELADAKTELRERHADSDAIRRASEAVTIGAVKDTRRRDRQPAPDLTAQLETLRAQCAEQAEMLKENERVLAEQKADTETLRRAGDALTLTAVRNTRRRGQKGGDNIGNAAEWVVPAGELEGAKSGALKAVWTTAYVNSLPDSSFLYVEPGGDKDSEGKTTPRSLRHFPYKDASGAVDMPHLRNALARIPQSSLPQDVKDRLTSRAQNILDNQKSLLTYDADVTVDVTDRGPESRSVDPLVQEARAIAVRYRSGGIRPAKPPREEKAQRPEPVDEDELRREARDLMLTALRGTSTT